MRCHYRGHDIGNDRAQETDQQHSDCLCADGGPSRSWIWRQSRSPRRQPNRPFAHGDRLERQAFGLAEGGSSEAVARGVLSGRTDPLREREIKVNQAAAAALGLSFMSAEIDEAEDIEPVFAKISRDGAEGVAWATGSLMFVERERLGAAALAHKLPAVAAIAEEVPSGLLMSYGQDYPEFFRRAAALTDKILKGSKPADLPVEQPTRFRLVLNLKAATMLGLTFPPDSLHLPTTCWNRSLSRSVHFFWVIPLCSRRTLNSRRNRLA